ncbi:hypothetical protein [Rhodoferax sp.]
MKRRTRFLALGITGGSLLATGCASTPPAPTPRIRIAALQPVLSPSKGFP